ncbi:MAG: heat shock protein HspQ [Gammaproteobacteria bacterium]|jgi:heat shock protein HspQ
MSVRQAKFAVGDIVHHRLFDYRGVVFDVDSMFALTDEWYEQMARSRPPKNEPWYHVLVHAATHTTYVAERNLRHDRSAAPVAHPMIGQLFSTFENGRYVTQSRMN